MVAFAEKLRTAGFAVWIDQGGIDAAFQWSQEIVEAIEGCRLLLLMASQTAFDSVNVAKELSLASEGRKHILPVYLEPVTPPASIRYQLAGIQHVELYAGEDPAFQVILRSLERLGVPRALVPAPTAAPEPEDGAAPRGLLICGEPGGDRPARKLFLYGAERVEFGSAKHGALKTVDLTLRLLPLRSRRLDPENWRASRLLSAHHGSLVFREGQYFLEDHSTNGIFLQLPAEDNTTLGVAPVTFRQPTVSAGSTPSEPELGVDETEAVRMKRPFPLAESLQFSLCRDVLLMEARVIQRLEEEEPRGLHLARLSNRPEHGYLVLRGEVTLGTGSGVDVVVGEGSCGQASVGIAPHDGEGYRVRVLRGSVRLDDVPLAPKQVHPLQDGARLDLAGTPVAFRHPVDDDFVAD